VAEAYRIHLAHLFDPVLAVHTSLIEPLPHQITGVYGEMLPRQPLRFLLADDPGAGKTIMAGLLIKELMIRGDVQRCLICVPGNLADQWQDELWFKFQTRFRDPHPGYLRGAGQRQRLSTRTTGPSSGWTRSPATTSFRTNCGVPSGTWCVDEAHKMSAHFWGNELEETKRYRLGRLLSEAHAAPAPDDRHAPQRQGGGLSALPGLLDEDRFEGRFREGVYQVDISDMMRRMVKEDLVRFNGHPLPRAPRLCRQLPAVAGRAAALRCRHQLRPRGVQPGGSTRRRQAARHRRFCADHPATPAGLVTGGHLPVAAPAARAPGEALAGGEGRPATGRGPRSHDAVSG
jgi:hypothetical protein